MKSCKNCGKPLNDIWRHCPLCGSPAPRYPAFSGKIKGFIFAVLFIMILIGSQVMTGFVFDIYLIAKNFIGGFFTGGIDFDSVIQEYLKNTSLISAVSSVAAICIVIIVFAARKSRIRCELWISRPKAADIVCALLTGVFFNLLVTLILSLIPFTEEMQDSYDEVYSFIGQGNRIIEIIGTVLIAPVAEEIFFRALGYGRLRRVMPLWPAAIISAVFFGLAHGNFISFTFTFILGIVLALTLEKTVCIFVPMAIHIGFNGAAYLIELLPETPPLIVFIAMALLAALVCFLGIYYLILTKKSPDPDPAYTLMLESRRKTKNEAL